MPKFKLVSHGYIGDRHKNGPALLNIVNTDVETANVHFYTDLTMRLVINGYEFGALLDSGCNKSICNLALVQKLKLEHMIKPPEVYSFKMASGQLLSAVGCILLPLQAQNFSFTYIFHILNEIHNNMINGTDIMFKFQAKIDFTNSTINFTTPIQVAPTVDTCISPGDTVKVQAHSVSHNIGVPDGLNGYITPDLDNINPFLMISDLACTMFDNNLCLLLTNYSNDTISVSSKVSCAIFTPLNLHEVSLTSISEGHKFSQSKAYGMTPSQYHNQIYCDCLDNVFAGDTQNLDLEKVNVPSEIGSHEFQKHHDKFHYKLDEEDASTNQLNNVVNKVDNKFRSHENQLYHGFCTNVEEKVPDKSQLKIIYDNSSCAWLGEHLHDFTEQDEPTHTKPESPFVTFDISLATVKGNERHRLRNLLRKTKNAFVNSTDTLGLNTLYPCRILLKENAVPKVIRPFRIPFHLQQEMMQSIQNCIKRG